MKIWDVSMLIAENMMVYKNREEKKPSITLDREFSEGGVNESVIKMNLHTGTHIDAPFHMQQGGQTVESLDLGHLITKCSVLDLTTVKDGITNDDLIGLNIKEGSFVLLKTKNSFSEDFLMDFTYLAKSGAEYLAQMKVVGVGIDALGIERDQPGHSTHKILFDNKIIIIEGLRLKEVEGGDYCMMALPLKIKGADGAPARVVLIKASEL